MKKLIQNFIKREEGNMLIFFALFLTILIGVSSLSMDIGKSYMVKAKMQQASDAAALAGAISPTKRRESAEKYFGLNFPSNYMGSAFTGEALNVKIIGDPKEPTAIEVSAQSTVTNHLQTDAKHKTTDVTSYTEVSAENKTSGKQATDIIMILDVSGSMGAYDCYSRGVLVRCGWGESRADSRISIMKVALNEFITSLYGNGEAQEAYRLGSVFFAGHTVPAPLNFTPVKADINGHFSKYVKPYYQAGTVAGTAAVSGADRILNATSYGGRGAEIPKVAIFMTDGQNTDPDYDYPSEYEDQLMLQQCTRMKNAGVAVFTISFGSEILHNSAIAALMSQCAGSNKPGDKKKYAFEAKDASELQASFGEISRSVGVLKIAK